MGSNKTPVQFAGLLRMMLERLQHLELWLTLYSSQEPYQKPYPQEPLLHLFGCDPNTDDLTRVPGLQNLRSLRFNDMSVSWPWFTLPKLREVYISSTCTIEPDTKRAEKSPVTSLQLDVTPACLSSREHAFAMFQPFQLFQSRVAREEIIEDLPAFVAHFHHLHALTISFSTFPQST